MVCSGPAHLPIWLEPQSGNSSDKTTFHETLKAVRAYQASLAANINFTWVADSAFYTVEKLQAYKDVSWISRVPETVKACRDLVEKPDEDFDWNEVGDGYKHCEVSSHYGEIAQRWLLVSSVQAYARESKTFERKLAREAGKLEKECWHQSEHTIYRKKTLHNFLSN